MSKNRNQAQKEEKEILLFSKYKKASNDILVFSLSSSNSMEQLAAARELQLRGGYEVIQLANTFCQNSDYKKRKLGVFILGQINFISEKEEQTAFDILTKLAIEDKSAMVRSTAIESMAHRCNKNSSFYTLLMKYCSMTFNNKSVYVRRATAFALSFINDEKTIPLLVSLCNDESDEVKNWAAFAINSNEYDTKEIRDCFFEMFSDPNSEIKGEAITGLARCHDMRVITVLKQELKQKIVYDDIIKAVESLGDRNFIPILESLLSDFNDDDELIQNVICKLQKKR